MWFVCDGLGLLLGFLTWIFLAFADWVVVRRVLVLWFWTPNPVFALVPLNGWGLGIAAFYQVLLFLAWFSHFQAATTDPGTIAVKKAPPGFQNARICRLCDGEWKPPRAHHCKTCKRCIFRMDHHCPWINNCVGFANQKYFVLFLCYTALSAGATLVLLAASVVYWLWAQRGPAASGAPASTATVVCGGLAAVESLAALLFVTDFLQEQVESITTNSTLVETYQRTHGARGTFWEHFRQVFGPDVWLWPLPVASTPATDYTEPAIPDDDAMGAFSGDTDGVGIAGEESEAPGGHSPPHTQGGDSAVRARIAAAMEKSRALE